MDRLPSQKKLSFFILRVVEVFPLFVNILCVKVIRIRRNERRFYFLVVEVFPREVLQPRVVLYFVWPIKTKSVNWFSLDHLVDEICCLDRPTSRNFVSSDLDLLRKDMVPNLLS